MKLASFCFQGIERIGAELDAAHLIDIVQAAKQAFGEGAFSPADMKELLNLGGGGLSRVKEIIAFAKTNPGAVDFIPKASVKWRPPIRNPGKICGVAMNNSASNDRKIAAPDHPVFFLKPASCLIGHNGAISVRPYYGSVHPEPELAVIIGKPMRDVDAVDALGYVAGYAIFNDITSNGMRAEDLFRYWAIYANVDNPDKTERREQNLSYSGRYKGADTFGVLGPWLVTRDAIKDPDNLSVYCKLDDEIIAEDSTRYYNFKVREVLSFISQFKTLQPGDVVACGAAFKPSSNRKSIHTANFQLLGAQVSIEIEGLGAQHSYINREQKEIGQWRLK